MKLKRLRQKGKAYYYDHGGKPRRWEPLGSDRADALRRYDDIERGQNSELRTVGHLVALHISKHQHLAAATLKSYRQYQAMLVKVKASEAPIMVLDQGHMNQMIDAAKAKAKARNTALFVKSVYAWAVSRGHIKFSPFTGMRLKNRSQRDRYMTDAEFIAIRENLPEKFKIALDMAFLLGLRVSGVVAIKFSDVKDGVLTFHPKKSKKPISYQMTPELQEVFDRAKALPGTIRGLTVLANRSGKPYHSNSVSGRFAIAAKKAGVKNIRFHDIRAKSASEDEETAQHRLGHVDGKTTAVYLRKPRVVMPLKRGVL